MTTPYTGVGTGQLIQTIVTLRELQQRDEAARLAREQFGLQQNMSQEEAVAHLQGILANTQDPQSLLPHVEEFAKRTGFSIPALQTIIKQSAPSVATSTAGAVARGIQAAGPTLDIPAAFSNIARTTPGAVAEDDFNKIMFHDKSTLLQGMSPDDKHQLISQALSKSATGMTLGDAALDAVAARLSPEELKKAAQIGKGLAPSAAQDAQIRLGLMENEIKSNSASSEDAYRMMELKIRQAEARAKLDTPHFNMVNDILMARDKFLQSLQKANTTATPEGKVINAQQINAYNEMLRKLAPEIYGPGGTTPLQDLPIDAKGAKTTGTTSKILDFLGRNRMVP